MRGELRGAVTQMLALVLWFAACGGPLGFAACGGPAAARRTPGIPSGEGLPEARAMTAKALLRPDESHLSDLRQLTFGGENAEASWSSSGAELIFQAHREEGACDRMFRIDVPTSASAPPVPRPVSSGAGATTCGFFLPGDRELIYSSTHLAGAACPPPPDPTHGYVWAIHPAYDIFRATSDGDAVRPLTRTLGYDAEATVCGVDGSIVFTSMRDGDLELYRMDADGRNVRRLTHAIGYDGGAFFDRDCTRIVWRASRPEAGRERDEYQRLLGQGLVRPSKLELWVADADGGNPMQLTYLDAVSFAPTFAPSQSRVIFSSNHGDPGGREFDLWAVDVTGANLERVTSAPGFDGFPTFSRDGQQLAFSSDRATAAGRHDTNVFVARWSDQAGPRAVETRADRILADIRYLADPARGGRGIGSAGLEAAATYLETRLRGLGLEPAGAQGGYRQPFEVPLRVRVGDATRLTIAGVELAPDDFRPATFSTSAGAEGELVLAGYGLEDSAGAVNDYSGLAVKGRIVVVRRFAPDGRAWGDAERRRRAGDIRRKAFVAREHGAVGMLVVDSPVPPPGGDAAGHVPWTMPEEAPLPALRTEGYGDAGLPVMFVRRQPFAASLARLEGKRRVSARLNVVLSAEMATAWNLVARVSAERRAGGKLPGVVVAGAHYDHLGMGESHSLEPGSHKPHLGADDNASGTATLLEIASILNQRRAALSRDVVLVAFSGEEEGVLGSTAFTRAPPAGLKLSEVVAMVNLDMVGRLRGNRVTILGRGSASEWPSLLEVACAGAHIDCAAEASRAGGDGFGPSDQMPFYAARIPVAHFFTGNHADYHRPSDTAEKINAAGAGQIAIAAAALIEEVAARSTALSFIAPAGSMPAAEGDMRSFGASLGSIPDYAGPPAGAPGVLLAGVRTGGAAERGGLRRGDILVRLGDHEIRSVEDLMYALGASHPGETVSAVVERADQTVTLPVTLQGPATRMKAGPPPPH